MIYKNHVKWMILITLNLLLERQQFGQLGMSTSGKLRCSGRLCAKCGKCRDWRFTGDSASWKWIQKNSDWDFEEWERYNEGIWKLFKRRNGATCSSDHDSFESFDYCGLDYCALRVPGYYHHLFCLCDDNK